MVANVSMLRRIGTAIQKMAINEYIDPKFSFDEFLEGAKVAYVVIRQITSNVKDATALKVLEGMMRPKLLQVRALIHDTGLNLTRCFGQVIQENIADSSVADKNKGREVHDIYGAIPALKAPRQECNFGFALSAELIGISLRTREGWRMPDDPAAQDQASLSGPLAPCRPLACRPSWR